MAMRYSSRRNNVPKPGGGLLTAVVVLLAVGACVLLNPPAPSDVAAVFSRREDRQRAVPSDVSAIVLPERSWYLVISDGQTVAATGALLEAEIIRGTYGEAAAVEPLKTEEITLRITATKAQLDALSQGANLLAESFDLMAQMPHLKAEDAAAVAKAAGARLTHMTETLQRALVGTENPVVRGLAGLVGSCRDAMNDIAEDATAVRVQATLAGMARQYAAYTEYLSGMQ